MRLRLRAALALLLALWLAALSGAAVADELRPGYLELTETAPGDWRLVWKQPFTNPPTEAPHPPSLPAPCRFADTPEIGVAGAAINGRARVLCTAPLGGSTIGMPGLIGQDDMLVRVQPLGEPVQALRLTADTPLAEIATRPGTSQVLRSYFVIGVEHILMGWDHLLFVIALVLLVRGWRRVVVAATAFTLAHSITLAAASLGVVGLPQAPVEALIALSILFLALEILKPDDSGQSLTRRYPWAIAFLFGLLHGFGFAGALREIGLPEGDIAAALFAFNLGVEAGQLLVIALVLALLTLFARRVAAQMSRAITIATYGIGIISAYWLIERVVG